MTRSLVRIATAVALSLVTAGCVAAQEPVSQTPITPSPVDSFLVLVPVRTPYAVGLELGDARDAQARAQLERAQADQMSQFTEVRINTAKADIDAFKARANEAKRAKQEATRITADADKASAETRKELLEKRRDLRRTESDAAAARFELAGKAIKALELEQTLQQRREDRLGSGVGSMASAQADNALTLLERQVLEAQREQADSNIDVSRRDKELVERRLSMLKAQTELRSPH